MFLKDQKCTLLFLIHPTASFPCSVLDRRGILQQESAALESSAGPEPNTQEEGTTEKPSAQETSGDSALPEESVVSVVDASLL